jgi:hypothetical protein
MRVPYGVRGKGDTPYPIGLPREGWSGVDEGPLLTCGRLTSAHRRATAGVTFLGRECLLVLAQERRPARLLGEVEIRV